jgi:hypothetical protein
MHGLTGGSWKRSSPATDTTKNDPAGNRAGHRGVVSYRRKLPPRQLPTLQRIGRSALVKTSAAAVMAPMR